MEENEPKIVLGNRVERIEVGAPREKPQPKPAPAPVQTSENRDGFTIEAQRRREQVQKQLAAGSRSKFAVNPVILTIAVLVPVLFLIAYMASGSSASTGSYDYSEVLKSYQKYMEAKQRIAPGHAMASVDAVRNQLSGITYLENTGHKHEAKQAWMGLFVSTQGDSIIDPATKEIRPNPLNALARRRLQR
jgi:hypothetical protein